MSLLMAWITKRKKVVELVIVMIVIYVMYAQLSASKFYIVAKRYIAVCALIPVSLKSLILKGSEVLLIVKIFTMALVAEPISFMFFKFTALTAYSKLVTSLNNWVLSPISKFVIYVYTISTPRFISVFISKITFTAQHTPKYIPLSLATQPLIMALQNES